MAISSASLAWRAAITSFSSSTLCTSSTIRPMHTVPRIIGGGDLRHDASPSSVGSQQHDQQHGGDSHSMPPAMPARQRYLF